MKGYPDEEMIEVGSFQRRNQPAADDSSQPYPRPVRQNTRFHRPLSYSSAPSDDVVAPGWPPTSSGPSDSQTLVDGQDSTASLRSSWRTDQLTAADWSPAPQPQFAMHSGPSTPMNQSNTSLAALLPHAGGRHQHAASKDWSETSQSSIQVLHERDDADTWGGWKRRLFKVTPFLTFVNMCLYFTYLALRVACIVWAQQSENTIYGAAWVFIAVEVTTALPAMIHSGWTMWSLKRRHRRKLRLAGTDVPTVDVFVTCCGEDDDVVLDTVRAACDLDYPPDRYRVIILDDGRSASLESWCSRLSMTFPNLFYMSREKIPGKPHYFKAGNLNFGLEQTHLLPGGAGQFMAALDADMIPERDWLRAVLPHLVIDPKMALSCPPQLFYNTPPSDPLAQSLGIFVHVIEPIKDSLGVAWCTGSGYAVRRDALDEIGNFPLGSLAEDVATSTLLLGKGWKTAYVHEPLQFGTIPEDFGSHLKQRTRWAIGTVDTAFKLRFCLWGEKVRRLTFAQRFSGFIYATLSLYSILVSISIFAIPVIILMGKRLVAYATDEQLRWLIRVCFASFISNRLCEFVLFIPGGYHSGQRDARYQLWMSPYIALSLVRSFVLPKWLGGQQQAFKPTGSQASALNERDPLLKKSMPRRLWAILVHYMALFHFAFVYMTLVAVAMTSYRCFVLGESTQDILLCLLTHAFWPPLTFLFLCTSLWTPVSYAIDPPMMPEREQLLERDPKTMVAHPTEKSKEIAFGGQAAWFEMEMTLMTLYTTLVFVASFIY
ncbi:hypothetical protein DCS_00052 [Drechmeria coniospora]|uniref:Glycosyltransferase 2-like domain-containing protein n=1 Tax=Drechmeria coniospora TaxID=98403 RepID=A0A151GP81_DRECN|nr:hypothetical protein DCS_00052 [Drechmeria coniospora]KYK58925.1 hypothetical protein DCS_00052 [Drechmeria coniospora]ODA76451.1 hypothetical protein RJ55_07720 [Drechmeria coniospora]